MPRTYTAAGIIRYDDKRGRAGNLLGVITFTDGKSLKVWGSTPVLHRQCLEMARIPVGEVRYTFKHSEKWGDALSTIERTAADHDLYDAARGQDEALGRSHKQGGYIADRIKKRVEADPESTYEKVMRRVG